jgi:CDP-diglyceride synthetase
VLRLILAFVDIMLHRRGPEDLPSATFLVWSLLALSISVELGVLFANDNTVRAAAVAVLVQLLDIWFVWALLRTFNKQRRFRQTMSALLGTTIIITLAGAPLVPLLTASAAASAEPQITLPLLLTALLGVWSIDIAAFVFARALGRPYVLCVAIMLGYVLLIVSLQTSLLPATT